MKLTHLAARDHNATTRIVAATSQLVKANGLDVSLLENVQTQKGDPKVRAMLQREAVADLLEALVAKEAESEAEAKAEAEQESEAEAEEKPKRRSRKSS